MHHIVSTLFIFEGAYMGLCCSYELDSECWLAELVLRSDTAAGPNEDQLNQNLSQLRISRLMGECPSSINSNFLACSHGNSITHLIPGVRLEHSERENLSMIHLIALLPVLPSKTIPAICFRRAACPMAIALVQAAVYTPSMMLQSLQHL